MVDKGCGRGEPTYIKKFFVKYDPEKELSKKLIFQENGRLKFKKI